MGWLVEEEEECAMESVRDAATQFLSNKRIAVTKVSRKTDIPPFSPHQGS